MGASQGTTKKEEEARAWADAKDIEIATLHGENAKLLRMIQQTMEQHQRDIETLKKEALQFENIWQQQWDKHNQCQAGKADNPPPLPHELAHERDEPKKMMIECDWTLVVSDAELLRTKMKMVPLSERCIERAGFNKVWLRLGDDGQEALLRLRRVCQCQCHLQFDTKIEYEQFAKHVCIKEFLDMLFIDTRKMSRKEIDELNYSYDRLIEMLIENMKKTQ